MLGRFFRWYYRRVTYPWLAYGVLLSAYFVLMGVFLFWDKGWQGRIWVAVGVWGFANALAAFVYLCRHPPRRRTAARPHVRG